MSTPRIRRESRGGRPGWLNELTGRWLPAIAGADDEGDAAAKAAADKAAADKAATEKEAADKAAAEKEAADKAEADKLGDAGKAALDAERKARRDAEKAAKEARKRIEELEAKDLSEAEKLKKQAEDGVKAAATATEKLRKANLISALADQGLTGGKAKAAARLLDDVQFDDDDEPTNLTDALTAAKAAYGEEVFSTEPAKPKPGGGTNGGDGGGDEKPELDAAELDAAKATGTKPERYAAMKGVSTLADFQAAQKRLQDAAKQ